MLIASSTDYLSLPFFGYSNLGAKRIRGNDFFKNDFRDQCSFKTIFRQDNRMVKINGIDCDGTLLKIDFYIRPTQKTIFIDLPPSIYKNNSELSS
jgi:hypothetical protein